MKVKSKALEVNLADYHVDVTIDAKYSVLQEVMSKYFGLMEGLNTFLKELSHFADRSGNSAPVLASRNCAVLMACSRNAPSQ